MTWGERWKLILRGARRSWTVISAALIAIVGYLQGQVEMLRKVLMDHTEIVLIGLGVLMAVLRLKTNTSLADKGQDKEP